MDDHFADRLEIAMHIDWLSLPFTWQSSHSLRMPELGSTKLVACGTAVTSPVGSNGTERPAEIYSHYFLGENKPLDCFSK
ncbi:MULTISPECIES: hypothetical protein [unclassified Ruegeria]|uniref:hypothetical protein n=1 Tax=unclassified Ruegeria TaxID=2625375 RepID=UPI001487BF05|nr:MULTISPECIES: hypothetical protein [unclassified Ruegeria]NOE42381.1 hypothetical protein [Ruegeria sp. HKCCD7319]